MALVGQAVSEKKIFEIVNGRRPDGRRTTDGRTPDHGHPISSPCEPNGSGELKMDLKFHNSVILSKFDKKSSKVNQVVFFSTPIGIPIVKALAKTQISSTQDFQILFSKAHNSKRGHDSDMKKIMGQLFSHEESVNEISIP